MSIKFFIIKKKFARQLGTASSGEGSEKKLSTSEELAWHDRSGSYYKQLSPPEVLAFLFLMQQFDFGNGISSLLFIYLSSGKHLF